MPNSKPSTVAKKQPVKKPDNKKMVVSAAKTVAKQAAPKKSDPAWLSIIKHLPGPYMAGQLAPMLLPFLSATHPPTQAAMSASPALSASAIPFAQSGSIGRLTGLRDIKPLHGRDGGITKLTITTMDLLGSSGSAGYSAGDIITSFLINPLDPIFNETKFAEYSTVYTKFRVKKMLVVTEPTVSAATAGAMSNAFFPDPMFDPTDHTSGDLQKIVGSQPGVDTQAIWQSTCAHMPRAPGSPLFLEPDGSDLRLCTAGRFVSIAAADIPAGSFCNYYLLAEVEYSVPTLEDYVRSPSAHLQASPSSPGGDTYQIYGSPPLVEILRLGPGRFVSAATAIVGGTSQACNAFYGIPPGLYLASCALVGTIITEPMMPEATAEAGAYGVTVSYQTWNSEAGVNWRSTSIVYVPPGVPRDVPQITLFCSAATISAAVFWMTPVYFPPALPAGFPSSAGPGAGSSLAMPTGSLRESGVYLSSQQGRSFIRDQQSRRQTAALCALRAEMAHLNPPLPPAPVITRSSRSETVTGGGF